MGHFFKILIFGNPITTVSYLSKVFGASGEEKGTYNEWYKEINVLDDKCNLEIDVITDSINANFDEILNTIDGIIYFSNPSLEEEFELLEMDIQIVEKVIRDVPIIIVFNDENGFLKIPVNLLLEYVWMSYPNMEAFVNIPPLEFHQVLHCLCIAMISRETPLNIENAWMRYPHFVEMANNYFKNQNYYYAAKAIKNAAIISEIFEKDDFFIICEQSANVFSKINMFKEASEVLEKVDKRKSYNFKKMHANAIILEGNKLFNKKSYELAAKQYEIAGQWISIELNDKELKLKSFKLAITSWISACKCENAFKLLDRVSHDETISILKEVDDKIISASDYLASLGNLEAAKEQLYFSLNTYQQEGLFDNIKKFSFKLEEILIKILDKSIDEKDIYYAKKTYDEIENLWDNFNVERKNLDEKLEKLINLSLEALDFNIASVLINKLNSIELKRSLTEISLKIEEKNEELKKKEFEENIERGIDVLNKYIELEQDIVSKLNDQEIKKANEFIKENNYYMAGNTVKRQADFLKAMGMDEDANQMLMKSLDILVEGNLFEIFFTYYFEYFNSLSAKTKKNYLAQKLSTFIDKLKKLNEKESYEKIEQIFGMMCSAFRILMLDSESKQISELFIDVMKNEALKTVNTEENEQGINKALGLIKKADDISFAFLENKKIPYEPIYKKITEIYISMDDLSSALAYNDKIENREIKAEVHKIIEKAEADKSAQKSKEEETSRKGRLLIERLSIIKNKGQDALHDRENELKQRKGLKRAYFNDALKLLTDQKYDKAIELYKENIIRLKNIKKYNLAGVSLAIACLLLLKENKFNEAINLFEETKNNLSDLGQLFTETFPVTLLEYIFDTITYHEEQKLKEASSNFENLPLFEEEIKVLYEYLRLDFEKKKEVEKLIENAAEIAKSRSEINKIIKDIVNDKKDISTRKMMKNEYWDKALDEISKNYFITASDIYLDAIPKLVDKKYVKQAAISLILGALILCYKKDLQIARSKINEVLKKSQEELEMLPEIKVLKLLLSSNDLGSLENLGLSTFIDNLILLEPEKELLKSFLEEGISVSKEEVEETLTRDKRGEKSKILLEIEQNFGKLQQKGRDEDFIDFFNKRKAMKKRLYEEILVLLNDKKFDEAEKKYYDLADRLFKRKDFKTSALMILLYGLAMFKKGEALDIIKNKIYEFLETLGLSKPLVRDTYYMSLIEFIIDLKFKKFEQFSPKIKDMLDKLPLFDEEKDLTQVDL